MMHHEKAGRKKARGMLSKAGYGHFAKGGHIHTDESEDKALIKREVSKAKLKLSDGGCAEGGDVKGRADRLKRGGKVKGKHGKGHTTVNVNVGHGQPVPVPVPKPVPVPVPVGAGAGGPPPDGGPPMPPPGAGPMPPPGGPPMGLKRGGRAKRKSGGSVEDLLMSGGFGGLGGMAAGALGLKKGGKASNSQRDAIKGMPDGQFKKGGRTKGAKFPVPLTAGAGGARGRLQKIKDYG